MVGPAHPNPSHLFLHRTLWPSQILPITPQRPRNYLKPASLQMSSTTVKSLFHPMLATSLFPLIHLIAHPLISNLHTPLVHPSLDLWPLPQWNLDPASEAVDKKPWRVIWPYHPILNTWSKGSGNTPTVDKFKHIDDLDEATVAELPPGHEDYSQGALIFPLYRIIAYHTVQQVRYKFAQWLELQLSQRDLAPYFHDLKLPDRGPVPLIPPEVVTRIAHADHHGMLVMHGKRNAHNSFELKKYCNKQEIPFPLTTAAAPGPPPATKANYPSLSETKSAKSATKLMMLEYPIRQWILNLRGFHLKVDNNIDSKVEAKIKVEPKVEPKVEGQNKK